MPKVALFFTKDSSYDAYGDGDSKSVLAGQATVWEDISEEDLRYLNLYRHRLVEYGHAIIVQASSVEVKKAITSLKETIEADKRREAERKAEEEKKKKAAAMKRALKKAKSEKELFEELKKKFGDLGGE